MYTLYLRQNNNNNFRATRAILFCRTHCLERQERKGNQPPKKKKKKRRERERERERKRKKRKRENHQGTTQAASPWRSSWGIYIYCDKCHASPPGSRRSNLKRKRNDPGIMPSNHCPHSTLFAGTLFLHENLQHFEFGKGNHTLGQRRGVGAGLSNEQDIHGKNQR